MTIFETVGRALIDDPMQAASLNRNTNIDTRYRISLLAFLLPWQLLLNWELVKCIPVVVAVNIAECKFIYFFG